MSESVACYASKRPVWPPRWPTADPGPADRPHDPATTCRAPSLAVAPRFDSGAGEACLDLWK
jgi:hypothetical protein